MPSHEESRAARLALVERLIFLRSQRYRQDEMAQALGISLDKVRELLYDPTGERRRGRQRRYAAKRRAQAKEID
jgi:hypothetical protein